MFKTLVLVAGLMLTHLDYDKRVGQSSSLPDPSTPASAGLGCATDILFPSIRPHHRRACQPPLALRMPEQVQYKIAVLVYSVYSLARTRAGIHLYL